MASSCMGSEGRKEDIDLGGRDRAKKKGIEMTDGMNSICKFYGSSGIYMQQYIEGLAASANC